jgi:hypothetical protein
MTVQQPPLSLEQACSLPDAEREARLATIRQQLLPRARSSDALPGGHAWEFPRTPELEHQLEELLVFERACCPGLGWQLQATPEGDGLRLEVTGLDGAALLASAQPDAPATSHGWRRLAGAGAIGFAASFFALCVLPMLVVAAGGAALAGSAASLDDPRWVGAGTLVAGFFAWRALQQRAARRSREAGDCGC